MNGTDKRRWRTLVQMLAGTFNKDLVDILICTVKSVDEVKMTCECTAISSDADNIIPGVKLNAEANDGFMIVPTIDSTILVAHSSRNNYYVLMYSDISKMVCIIDNNNSFTFDANGFVWNEGILGGMVKVNALLTKLNNLENKINTIIAWGATVTPALATPPLVPTVITEIEDTKIKH